MKYLKKPLADQKSSNNSEIEKKVSLIISKVKRGGIKELKRISEEIDGYKGPIWIEKENLLYALQNLSEDFKRTIRFSMDNLISFHRKQMEIFSPIEDEPLPGLRRGMRFLPVATSGSYIPGGRYPLASSVLMNVVPAMVAGVGNIIIASPPSGKEGIHPVTLATAAITGVDRILALGGAQAIAAMAFGSGDIPACDIITGPGNKYVTEAKRQLFGTVGIDSLAGPSEVLIIADEKAKSKGIALDLMAQAEHEPWARACLFSTNRKLAESVISEVKAICDRTPRSVLAQSWENCGTVVTGTMEEAIEFANEMAPEHLQICTSSPRKILCECSAYGAAFLGYSTPVPYGDYVAGTNHILPTGGSAKFSGGLWTGTFLRPLAHVEVSETAEVVLAEEGIRFATQEGLSAHAESLKYRLEPEGTDS